jgi:spore coat protein U domain-containing protein, fimbrial subunit CupE1/2/3/6
MSCRIRVFTAVLLLLFAEGGYAFQCSVVTTPVNFGFYDVFAATDLNSTGTVTVTCNAPPQNPAVPVTLSLTAGGSGSFAQRRMSSTSGQVLNYNLYSDAAKTTIAGDGSGGSVILSSIISKSVPWNVTIYGRIPARQNAVPGVYSDAITATIVW